MCAFESSCGSAMMPADDSADLFAPDSSLSRSALALGVDAMRRLRNARVAVFGIGGVGSWAAEALVRTGLGHITLVDPDCVALSNINRQVPASLVSVGKQKVQVMAERLALLSELAEVEAVGLRFSAESLHRFDFESYDYVIDAIDSLSDKMLLVLEVTGAARPVLFSSMGAALKMDPGQISVAEFWRVHGCPLAAAMRSRMRRSGRFPARKFQCVFSPERIPNHPEAIAADGPADPAISFGHAVVNGSLCHITASFGMRLASLVIAHICSRCDLIE